MIRNLRPFTDLYEVDDVELLGLDFKRAESENVGHQDNYPKFMKGGDTGVLLIHGFTASPLEMKPLADYLHAQGFSVYNARIAGHGSDYTYLNMTGYDEWYDSVKYGFFVLKRNCKKVFVIGESMGGLISLMTCRLNGGNGAVLLAPCIRIKAPLANLTPFLSRFMPKLPKLGFDMQYADIYYNNWPMAGVGELYHFTEYFDGLIEDMDMPLLGFQFPGDVVVNAKATGAFFDKAPSSDKTYNQFPKKDGQTHILTSHFNQYRDEMFAEIADWLNKRGA